MTKGIGWTKKSTTTSSSFDFIIYVLSHATKTWIFWLILKASDVSPHVPIFNYLKLELLLLSWNNLRCSIHMFGLSILWHVAQCKYAMWHFKMNLIQNINIRLVPR